MKAVSTSVSERLSAARQGFFVGRTAERAFFRRALEAPSWPFSVLHICGPGGVGKTTLLCDFASSCKSQKISVATLDARHIVPSPDAFEEALAVALGLHASESAIEFLARQNSRCVILVDAAELLVSLDAWLRETFLPGLPDTTLLILAGRHRPNAAWNSDAGLGSLMHTLALRNLEPAESRNYLAKRKVPRSHHRSILDFTHGHPLALVLISDLFSQGSSFHFEPLESPDVVRALLERIVQDVPGAAHRQALEACAVVRVTTEPLLAALLEIAEEGAHDLFRWLQDLSFMESGRSGISPHDLAREVLETELRWRNPDRHGVLLQRASAYYDRDLRQATGQQQRALLHNHVFLHRSSPAVRPFFEWQEVGHLIPGAAHENEITNLITMVARHEGAESAQIAAAWFSQQPQNIFAIRDPEGNKAGFASTIALHEATLEQINSDPAACAVWSYMSQYAPLQPDERAMLFRFWMAHDTYQSPSATQSLIFLTLMQHLLTTPRLAFTSMICADPFFWEPIFSYTAMTRLATNFEVGGRTYGIFVHDWRVMPVLDWLAMLSAAEVAQPSQIISPPLQNRPIILSHAEFAHEVRAALRKFQSPSALHQSPLLQSRLVFLRTGPDATISEQVEELRATVQEACSEIESSPREAKLYRAIYHTYLNNGSTQEQVAEELDMPFSTYRRHLKAGVARLTEILWQKDTNA